MANIKSQIKRNRQNEVRRQRNKAERSTLKTEIKKFVTAAGEGDESAQDLFRSVTKHLDQAAAKGVIHKNAAARKKARLAKRLGASS